MKHLSFLGCTCLVLLVISCKKNIKTKQNGEPSTQSAPNYFKLPDNGQFVDIQLGNGKKTSLYQVDSMYITEGDIVLTPWQVELLKNKDNSNARAHITTFARLWRSGVVPFTIAANLSATSQNIILNAMQEWQTLVPGLTFVPRTTTPDYIHFNASTVNNSYVGRVGGQQTINLVQDPTWGVDRTSAQHEIGHALGLFHEQSRTDRDNAISINWSNIRPDRAHNFNTFAVEGYAGANLGTFDFNSIMLYPSFIDDPNFVFNTTVPAMSRLDGTTWGVNWWISAGDVETVARMYVHPFPRIEYQNIVLNYNDGGTWSEYYSEDEMIVRFYQDRAFTIPATTTRPMVMRYEAYASTLGGVNWTQLQVVNVPVGSSEISMGVNITDYRDEWGTVVRDDRFGYRVTLNNPFLLGW